MEKGPQYISSIQKSVHNTLVQYRQGVGSQSKEAHIQEGEDREAEKGEDRER